MSTTYVRYLGKEKSLAVNLIKTWVRGEITHAVMGTGSGAKAYIRNDIFTIFHNDSQVDSVSMVRANGPFFLIVRKGKRYFEVGEDPKELEVIKTK